MRRSSIAGRDFGFAAFAIFHGSLVETRRDATRRRVRKSRGVRRRGLSRSWDAATGQKLQTMRGHNDFVDGVKWSLDGSRLASAGIDNAVRIWDPRSGQEAFVLRGRAGMFHDLSWSSDGAQLAAACSDRQIWVWDARRGFEPDAISPTSPQAQRVCDKPRSTTRQVGVLPASSDATGWKRWKPVGRVRQDA